jgi:hypothetical protein
MTMSLDIGIDPRIPREELDALERAARRYGLPLALVEDLACDPARCAAFAKAEQRRDARALAEVTGLPAALFAAPALPRPRAPRAPLRVPLAAGVGWN